MDRPQQGIFENPPRILAFLSLAMAWRISTTSAAAGRRVARARQSTRAIAALVRRARRTAGGHRARVNAMCSKSHLHFLVSSRNRRLVAAEPERRSGRRTPCPSLVECAIAEVSDDSALINR